MSESAAAVAPNAGFQAAPELAQEQHDEEENASPQTAAQGEIARETPDEKVVPYWQFTHYPMHQRIWEMRGNLVVPRP